MNSDSKGKRGELEWSKFLRGYGYDARRGRQYKGTPESPDVVGLPGVHLEVKRWEVVTDQDIRSFMHQSQSESAPGEIPVVPYRENRKRWKVAMYASDLARMAYCADEPPHVSEAVMVMTAEDFLAVYEHWRVKCGYAKS